MGLGSDRGWAMLLASGIALFAATEMFWWWQSRRRLPDLTGVGSNVVAFLVGELLRLATFGFRLGVFVAARALAPFDIPTSIPAFIACYVGVDFLLYLLHRLMHETRIGWAFHSVHHTSHDFNLSLGGRVHWVQRLVDDFFYLPLAFVGFDPLLILGALEINRASQYWVHTEMIGKLGILDAFLNTPSNHRVHHARRDGGRRSNYGSNFMIWDRLFGTYEPEGAPEPYGTDLGDVGNNPLRIQWAGLRRLLEGRELLHPLKIAYTAWFVVWCSSYLWWFGPQTMLWMCCIANTALLVGLWGNNPVILSFAGLAVLLAQILYAADLFSALLVDVHLSGATRYLFDSTQPAYIRGLSLFHLWTPPLLLALLWRFGYDRRALFLVVLCALIVFPICFVSFEPNRDTNDRVRPAVEGRAFDRDFNINWVHGFYDKPSSDPGLRDLLRALFGYLVVLVLPTHLVLRRIFKAPEPRHAL
jgi:sterol desaturase/sphingolipid hydroxylase (fatty acid hydroxylase superfamily)